jgi:hypothetical protein
MRSASRIASVNTADDAGRAVAGEGDRVRQRGRRLDPVMAPVGIAGDDDVAPPRQRPADRIERLASHDDGVARRDALEVREVLGKAPGQRIVDADAALRVHRDDHGEEAGHGGDSPQTATGALMAGCGS